ncbi:MAG: MBL fold metallo-hydrolase, partial [Candidatus Cloacimonadota bacterium]|nr:MBL fold metallo-hydrolase [Candidatus Cloacimonadota bacterium]
MYKIKWFGHSMWQIKFESITIIIDPFEDIGYKLPNNLKCNFVLSSHDHFDHNNFKLISGDYTLINEAGNFSKNGFKIKT